jgi:subtilisin family serine protease
MTKARSFALAVVGLAALSASVIALAASSNAVSPDNPSAPDLRRYVVELADPPLALYDGRELSVRDASGATRLPATVLKATGELKLDRQSPRALAYLRFLKERHQALREEASRLLGRPVAAVYQYRNAINGMTLDLTEAEAEALGESPLVESIEADVRYELQSFAGPPWIGANDIWDGLAGFPEARGEDIVVGVIDSGVNWEHPSFSDSPVDGYDFVNPYGVYLGLCSDPEVECNDKLVGVYDFVEDDPSTGDVVEENTKGRDNDGHGSHVASIAVGNRVNVLFEGTVSATLSGVAPRANLIAYRVCFVGEPAGADTGGCAGSAILAAIDQAIDDGVDIINYSVGSSPSNPWALGSIARAYLAARGAGILVVTSAGNEGPDPGTIGSPANAPWVVSVGSATHNQIFGYEFAIEGGPDGAGCLEGNGPAILSGTGPKAVVYAGDVGDPQGCSAFPAESMAGAIALISRGGCAFADKVDNAEAAGADFMVVYNNVAGAPVSMAVSSSTISSCMISRDQGLAAVEFLQTSADATGQIRYPIDLFAEDAFADNLSGTSSRGPALAPAEDILKPNLIAPGIGIYAASEEGQAFRQLSGTSMASPHVAGAAALLKSVHPDWSPSQLASAIETTATAESAVDDGEPATARDRGAGRPQLGEAVAAGLYLNVTAAQFTQANPSAGGEPRDLNLPGLADANCPELCSFTRTVTDQAGGGSWTAEPVGFPAGVNIAVTPSTFSLSNGGSRSLSIDIDLSASGTVGEWVEGRIRLRSSGSPDQFLTVSVFYGGGELPSQWTISDPRDGGSTMVSLSGLATLPDLTLQSGGLQPQERTEESLPQDPTNDDPYDGSEGVFTKWHALPEGALWLRAETLSSTSEDIDLYVGRDDDGDGLAELSEELCSSTSPIDIELCDLYDLPPGDYWIVVQNWTASSGGFTGTGSDQVTLLSAGIAPETDGRFVATGPGRVSQGERFDIRLSWSDLAAVTGDVWLGAVGIGTSRDNPNNVGVVPVRFNRSGIATATFPLFDGVEQALALAANGTHDRLFIDVPESADSLTVSVDAQDPSLNNALGLELRRLSFAAGLADPPFAASPSGASAVVSASGSGGNGPSATVSGASLQSGRWYAVLNNGNGAPAGVKIRADLTSGTSTASVHRGLWEPSSRPGLGQGYEYNWGESGRALIWYTYDEDGQPAWYIAGAADPGSDAWVAPLYRVTNDGMFQQLARVGTVSVTMLAENDSLFSFTLFGESGTERMQPLSANTCPQVNGLDGSYTGLWYRGVDGLGGASVLMNATTQAQIHYLFDGVGAPRWLVAQDPDGGGPGESELPMLQFSGYCAVCSAAPVSFDTMGTLERSFDSENAGSWTFDYLFEPPLTGDVQRTDQIVKLTGTLDCD